METEVLVPVEKKIEPVIAAIEPKEFYQDREGLFVFTSFKERVADKAEKVSPNEFPISSFNLAQSANDEEIEKALPAEHLFSESEVCAVIATLIEKQPKGEEGTLLNDGSWNLFYTKDCVVSVDWYSFSGEWYVYAWDRDDYAWRQDYRVFSPATAA